MFAKNHVLPGVVRVMWVLILLVVGLIFLAGALIGIRLQEINLRRRERRLSVEWRRLAAAARTLDASGEEKFNRLLAEIAQPVEPPR